MQPVCPKLNNCQVISHHEKCGTEPANQSFESANNHVNVDPGLIHPGVFIRGCSPPKVINPH